MHSDVGKERQAGTPSGRVQSCFRAWQSFWLRQRWFFTFNWVPLVALMLLFIGGHAPFLRAPFVNLESSFAGAAERLATGEFSAAIRYLDHSIANPLGTMIGIVPFYWVFGQSELTTRLFPLLCGAMTLWLVYALARSVLLAPAGVATLAAAIVGLNPFFWAWSGLAYSDCPFTFAVCLSVYLADRSSRRSDTRMAVLAGLAWAAAFLIKYNAVLFIPATVYPIVASAKASGLSRRKLTKLLICLAIPAALPGLTYLIWVRSTLGYLLNPHFTDVTFGATSVSWPVLAMARLCGILVWIGLFSWMFGFFSWWRLASRIEGPLPRKAIVILGVIVAWAGGRLYLHTQAAVAYYGEMRLGFLSNLSLNNHVQELLAGTLLFLGIGPVVGCVLWARELPARRGIVAFWLLSGTLFYATARPTNRYLFVILPPLALYASALVSEISAVFAYRWVTRSVVAVLLGICAVVCIFNSAYFQSEGRAAARVAQYANEYHLGPVRVEGNSVWCHSGYLLDPQLIGSGEPAYDAITLSTGRSADKIIYASPVTIAGYTFKRYALVRAKSGVTE